MKSFKNTTAIGTLMGFLFIAGVALAYVFDHVQSSDSAMAVDTTQELVQPMTMGTSGSATAAPAAGSGTSKTTSSSGSSKSTSSGSTAPSGTTYKDGTYTSVVPYFTPEGEEQIGVSLSISHDSVADVNVQNSGYAGTSRRYQNAFSSQIRSYVVGKSIASLNLSRISGASLTTAAFDQALANIKAEAHA